MLYYIVFNAILLGSRVLAYRMLKKLLVPTSGYPVSPKTDLPVWAGFSSSMEIEVQRVSADNDQERFVWPPL